MDSQIPGFREISDWPFEPHFPLQITCCGAYRCPHASYYVDLEDSVGTAFNFFFDGLLGRLCYGKDEDSDDAAYLKKGSKIQKEIFQILEELAPTCEDSGGLLRNLEHARTWV